MLAAQEVVAAQEEAQEVVAALELWWRLKWRRWLTAAVKVMGGDGGG